MEYSMTDHSNLNSENRNITPKIRMIIDSDINDEDEDDDFISQITKSIIKYLKRYSIVLKIILFCAFNIYLGFAIHLTWHKTPSYCYGIKFLTIITGLTYFIALYYLILKRFIYEKFCINLIKPIKSNVTHKSKKYLSIFVWLILLIGAVSFIVYDSISSKEHIRMVSGAGLIGFLILGYLFSKCRSKIIWRQILWGVSLQFVFGLIIIRWSFGKDLFECFGGKISAFLGFTDSGSSFVFGYLVTGKFDSKDLVTEIPIQSPIIAFKVFPVIVFFSFFVSILYYYGIMQILIIKLGWFLQQTIGTTACESLNASSNIFLGMAEAPLMIKPFLPIMTKSELHTVMTAGFATIAGSVMAAYMSFGVNPSHLLSASVMSAPAALACSKLLYPEKYMSKTTAKNIIIPKGIERNVLEAAANGASASIKLCANITVNLIAFIAFIQFLDILISWFASLVLYDFIDFKWILSKIFIPISLMMGVHWDECDKVAQLVGLKTVISEFIAYQELGKMIQEHTISKRSESIATFALCGFSNFPAIGIQLGCLGAMAPERKSDLASIALRAMIAGATACFMTACIAGMLISINNSDGQSIATIATMANVTILQNINQ